MSALLLPFAAPTSRQVFPASEGLGDGYGGHAAHGALVAPGLDDSSQVVPLSPGSSSAPDRVSLDAGGGGREGRRSLHQQASTGAWLAEDASGFVGCAYCGKGGEKKRGCGGEGGYYGSLPRVLPQQF